MIDIWFLIHFMQINNKWCSKCWNFKHHRNYGNIKIWEFASNIILNIKMSEFLVFFTFLLPTSGWAPAGGTWGPRPSWRPAPSLVLRRPWARSWPAWSRGGGRTGPRCGCGACGPAARWCSWSGRAGWWRSGRRPRRNAAGASWGRRFWQTWRHARKTEKR